MSSPFPDPPTNVTATPDTATAASPDTAPSTLQKWPVHRIQISDNSRLDHDPEKLTELIASIRDTKGPLQSPVGYTVDTDDGPRVELILGGRRLAAQQHLAAEDPDTFGTLEVRIVDQPSRRDLLKWNLVENLQRDNLRPSEIGKRFAQMLDETDPLTGQHLFNRAQIAEETGCSDNYVHDCLALVSLPADIIERFDRDHIDPRIASSIAGLPDALQPKAAAEILDRPAGPMTRKEAGEHIRDHYRADLRQAPFEKDDATLGDELPACHDCPWWGGNRDELPSNSRNNVCLNPACFRDKCAAHARIEADQGTRVLDPEESRRLLEPGTGDLSPTSGYIDLDSKPGGFFLTSETQTPPTWREALDGQEIPIAVLYDEEGRRREIAETALALTAATQGRRASLFRPESSGKFQTEDQRKLDQRIRSARDQAAREVKVQAIRELLTHLREEGSSTDHLRAAVQISVEIHLQREDITLLLDWFAADDWRSQGAPRPVLDELLRTASSGLLTALLILLPQVRLLRLEGWDHWREDDNPMTPLLKSAEWEPAQWTRRLRSRVEVAERKTRDEHGE